MSQNGFKILVYLAALTLGLVAIYGTGSPHAAAGVLVVVVVMVLLAL
jgi:hypothetical protein